MFEYPIVQILLYLALLLSPPDATRISITGPTPADAQELRLTVTGWAVVRDGVESPVSLSEGRLLLKNGQKYDSTDVGAHVAPVKGHDWSAIPKLKLAGLTTLEKTDAGYVLRLNDDGGSATRTYTLTFHRPALADPATAISVNVIGMVNNPGAYQLAKGATLLDAIVAAGGFNRLASRSDTRLVRGPAGEKAQTFTINVEKLQQVPDKAITLQDRDTIFVPERFL